MGKLLGAWYGKVLFDRRQSGRDGKDQEDDGHEQKACNQPEEPVLRGREQADKHAGAEEKEDHTHDSWLFYQRDLRGRGKPYERRDRRLLDDV